LKTIVKLIAVITAVFILAAFISYRVITNYYNCEEGMRTVVMNRITSDVEDRFSDDGSDSELSQDKIPDMDIYRQEYAKKAVPDEIRIVSINAVPHRIDADASYIQPVFGPSRTLRGFLYFIYSSNNRIFTIEMAGIILLISYFAVILVILLGYYTMIRPFNRLSEYPEKIAKGRIDTGIPESRQRLFGKYVWGMNMLKDEMKHKENSLNIMEKEKQTLIISIAHGIKTPLSNIKLYAEAIERGIYHEDKKPNEKDAETAAKISRNVEKVEALVKDIMDKSAEYNVDYTPKINSFYLEELMKMVKKEYSGRMELLHIPFETVCENNPLVTSDKDGIYTIISQLMENAIKYGSGQGISIIMGRQDEDVFITVKNKGNVLSEEETAYVFKSFWRGSNSQSTEGQGIGLYVSRKIAEALSGDIFMKAWEAEDMTEVTLIIPTSIG
jgi:signal transduction histidine kinase